jgi:hypothetical protein
VKMPDRATLTRSQYVIVATVVLVVVPVIGLALYEPVVDDLYCEHFELPDYEAALGFRLERTLVRVSTGETEKAWQFTQLRSDGPLARAGVVVGDAPRLYHGLSEVCGEFAALARGEAIELELASVLSAGDGPIRHRLVRIAP